MNVKMIFVGILAALMLTGCKTEGVIDISRVGVCSWSWHASIAGIAEEMKSADVKGIHLALNPFIHTDGRHGNAEETSAWELVKAKVASGEWVVMATMIGMVGENYSTLQTIRETGGIVPDATWEANQRIVTRGAQLTQELGCEYLSTHAGFLDIHDETAFKKHIERVTWMRDECRKYGVTLILESGQETAEDLAVFMQRVPGIGINFDPANMILYAKGKPLDAVKVLAPWIRQVHVKDAVETATPGTWGREMPWGEGEVGARAFIVALQQLGYSGNYVIEREGGAKRVADIRQAIRALTE